MQITNPLREYETTERELKNMKRHIRFHKIEASSQEGIQQMKSNRKKGNKIHINHMIEETEMSFLFLYKELLTSHKPFRMIELSFEK